jgi:hypothetical protein
LAGGRGHIARMQLEPPMFPRRGVDGVNLEFIKVRRAGASAIQRKPEREQADS